MEIKFRNLKPNEIECRISRIESNWMTLLLYKTSRTDMNLLDETVGAMNWQKHYSRDNANCIISIWDEEKQQWIEKEDTGTESSSEAEKGLASDSAKRAGFCWGIGRELYSAPNIIIFPRKDMGTDKRPEFFDKGDGRYTTKTYFWVEIIGYDENDNIKDLIIRDHKNNIRFMQLSKEKEKELLKLDEIMKKLIVANEEKDETFDREKFYKYFDVDSDDKLTYKQVEEAIGLLEKRLK